MELLSCLVPIFQVADDWQRSAYSVGVLVVIGLFIIYTRRLQMYVHLSSQMVYDTYVEFLPIYLIYL